MKLIKILSIFFGSFMIFALALSLIFPKTAGEENTTSGSCVIIGFSIAILSSVFLTSKKYPKLKKAGDRIAMFFSVFFALAIASAYIFRKTDSGATAVPSWYIIILLTVPTVFTALYGKIHASGKSLIFRISSLIGSNNFVTKKVSLKKSEESEFKAPRTKKKQMQLADELISKTNTYVSLANESDCVSLFILWYDKALDSISKLTYLSKAKFKGSPKADYRRLQDEFQWHLCDAIVRAKEATVSEIKEKYKNSREFQRKAFESFEGDIKSVQSRFSADTSVLANDSIEEIRKLVRSKETYSLNMNNSISCIDRMDGVEFEKWCANLLGNNGFSDVQVTPSSGDQGVDVIAEKDGIRYAIQCKCYSSDLGNTPVQEVNTGKTIYHCQIGVVMTNRYFTKGAKEAASATGVLLWDRDKLTQMLEYSGV